MIPLFILDGFVGWCFDRNDLKGVEGVTETAIAISWGALNKRVEVKKDPKK